MSTHVKVIDRGWNKIKRNILKLDKGRIASVGWQGAGASEQHDGMTNAELASLHEFGSSDGTLPSRPVHRQTFDVNKASYQAELDHIGYLFFDGYEVDGMLFLLGERYRGDMLDAVKSSSFAPWAESTRAQKAREGKEGDVPLWDTSQMLNALSVEITKLGVFK